MTPSDNPAGEMDEAEVVGGLFAPSDQDGAEAVQPGVGSLNGLITNDKFCLTRTIWLRLSWPRARVLRRVSVPLYLRDEFTHRGGDDAAATQLASSAYRRPQWPAASSAGTEPISFSCNGR
jgi:hypothetical protein